uniref:Peptidyl-prolyl cis-trans isomerase, putative n=1 Tax=Neospora caninum (strain Liverpool) TaxID=572307 RepID=F0JBB1_NEOCL|nr:peptidyl-prolyl cis-trans isomerase, putative [Neospora caninum Liverpool]CEL71378.1 TPA: peptidyl-prolyl cis-trans isomerase, putative [Neospora caninum Liverpool]
MFTATRRSTICARKQKTGTIFSPMQSETSSELCCSVFNAGEPFSHSDLIHIQNPADAKTRYIEGFYHVREGKKARDSRVSVFPPQKSRPVSKAFLALRLMLVFFLIHISSYEKAHLDACFVGHMHLCIRRMSVPFRECLCVPGMLCVFGSFTGSGWLGWQGWGCRRVHARSCCRAFPEIFFGRSRDTPIHMHGYRFPWRQKRGSSFFSLREKGGDGTFLVVGVGCAVWTPARVGNAIARLDICHSVSTMFGFFFAPLVSGRWPCRAFCKRVPPLRVAFLFCSGQDVDLSVKGVPAEKDSMKPATKKTEWMERILAEAGEKEDERKAAHNKLIPNMRAVENKAGDTAREGEGETPKSPGEAQGVSHAAKSEEPLKHSIYTTHRLHLYGRPRQFEAGVPRAVGEGTHAADLHAVPKTQEKGGSLNIELHADMAPRACDSFLRLCAAKYFDDTIFHRCIRNFMIQGGRAELREKSKNKDLKQSPRSISGFPGGGPFEDEFDNRLVHQGIGVVSMANDGKHSNLSEFFITFKSCEHLNNKHTIFGRVVGGLDVLRQWEKLETDKSDKPLKPPKIAEVIVFKNPFDDAKKEMEDEKRQEEEKEKKKLENAMKPWFNNRDALDSTASHPERHSNAVGKYLPSALPSGKTSKPGQTGAAERRSETAGVEGPQKRSAQAAGLSPVSTGAKQNSFSPVSRSPHALLEYAAVPQKVKVARKTFDFSSW